MKKINREEKRVEEITFSLQNGLSIKEPKSGGKVTFYEKEMVQSLLKKKLKKKYKKLIEQLLFLLSVDDESGTAVQEALDQVQKFREEVRNKYKKILKKKEAETIEKQLTMMEKEVARKLYIFNHFHTMTNIDMQNKSR